MPNKVIIFTQFFEMLNIIREKLNAKGYKVFCIYGAVDSMRRLEIVKEFNDYQGPAIICMTEAGAYGINLKSATYVIHYDLPWSIAKMEQREGRADRAADKRIGGELPLTVYNLVAKGTIDEYVASVLHKKNKASVDILGDMEKLENAGLSPEDIQAILRL